MVLLAAALAGAPARAGDAVAEPARKQFRQSSTYPYVFQPDCYLATKGPVPLRFSVAAPGCSQRSAPPLIEAAKGKEKAAAAAPAPAPATGTEVISTTAHPDAAYQPPVEKHEEEQPADAVDFKRAPEEVLEFFRNNDGKAGKRIYLFDPIFQPVLPNDLPKSKATYTQKP